MNYKMIVYIIGNILKIIGGFLLLPLIVGAISRDCGLWSYLGFLIPSMCSLILGFILTIKKPVNQSFNSKEGLVIVGLSWIIISLIGCLPFVISREIPSFTDAFFETVSGFTTTGASILTNVEALSKPMLFWRSFTHWIGGMGVLVFVILLLPNSAKNIHLLKAESPGPSVGKIVSKVKMTASILYIVYTALTVLEFIFLIAGQMNPFDAICNSLATAGTGGFSIRNAGIGSYSLYSQIVIGVFMLLFGINFNLYFLILIGQFKNVLKSEELRWYLFIIFASVVMISINLSTCDNALVNLGVGTNIKDAFFQVSSIITTTGFATVDFTSWPMFSKTILFILMFVGACAGSTGGGIKVSRIVIFFKATVNHIHKLINPNVVINVHFEKQKVSDDVVKGVLLYIPLIFVIFLGGTLIVSLDGFDFTTNVTAVASCLNNIGPGLTSSIGPMGNFSSFSYLSKYTLIILMLIGRLEIFPILSLFSTKTWRK